MDLTREKITEEIQKCSMDPVYFIRNYINIEHPIKGIVPFDLYRFQERIVREVLDNRFNIIRKFRQAGITTICAAYSLWSIIFKNNHHVMVVSIGDRESTAFLRRVVMMYDDLPKWLAPAIKEKNKHSLHLSTDSRVRSQPAGAGRGESVSHLMVDEAAFIDKMREFWAAIYPTISTGGKATLISTVNGMSNLYYEIYKDADLKKNSFNVIDLNWREHPEYTKEWSEEHRPIIGERMWLQEYECEFLGTGDTFIDRHTLARLNENIQEEYRLSYSNRMRVFKDPDPYYTYVIGVDASYGRDRDHSAFHIINTYTGEQVAEFYSNRTPLSDFAKIVAAEGNRYNTAHVVVERNGLGIPLIQELFDDLEYENLWMDEKGEFGIQITQKVREGVLASLEEFLRSSKIRINSERTVGELLTFIITENGKVEADEGYNDDLVMSLALACYCSDEIVNNSPVIDIDHKKYGNKEQELQEKFKVPIHITKNGDKYKEDISWVIK
jgi:hypothetical protein